VVASKKRNDKTNLANGRAGLCGGWAVKQMQSSVIATSLRAQEMKGSELICSPPSIARVGQQQNLAFEKSFRKALGASQLCDVPGERRLWKLDAVEDGAADEAWLLSTSSFCCCAVRELHLISPLRSKSGTVCHRAF